MIAECDPQHPIINPSVPEAPRQTSSGLLGFLNSYPNPLSRLPSLSDIPQSSLAYSSTKKEVPGTFNDPDIPASSSARYSLSTIIIVALIAFLIGSLLRSLLSPADFIYVVTDLQEAGDPSTGWREIKRLLEVKYIAGGWDFQIAVVRRH
jgi:hypothetical protein